MNTTMTSGLVAGISSIAFSVGAASCGVRSEPHSPSGSYAPLTGLDFYYELHGPHEGEPLVLIHGGGSTIGTSFGHILPSLTHRHRIIAVELQGHGHTPDRDAPETFEQDADDVAGLMHHLHMNKASFFGFSNGGNTAMQVAIRHPELVRKLIVASAFYRRDGLVPGFFDGMQQATLSAMPQSLQDAFLRINPDPAKLQRMFEQDRGRMLRFIDWKDDALRSIKAPTLIINGDQDVVLTEHALAMSRLIEHSRLMVLPATHGSYLGSAESRVTDPNLVSLTAEAVTRFLQDD